MGRSRRMPLCSCALAVMALMLAVQAADAVAPRVTATTPAPDATLNVAPTEIVAHFDQQITPGDVNRNTFILLRSGGDGQFGNGNDVQITPVNPPALTAPAVATFDLTGESLPDDLYGVSLIAAGPPGAGYALLFDGHDDYVEMPIIGPPDYYKVDHMTLEAWVYLNSATNPMVAAGRGDDYNLGVMNGCIWARFESPCGEWIELTDDTPLPVGDWVHLAMTYDRVALRLYVNGTEVANLPWTQAISYCWGDWAFFIGRQDSHSPEAGGPRFFDGVVDSVRLWNVAHDQAALRSDMYRQLTGAEAGLVGIWNLDDGAGDYASDLTPTANHGRLGVAIGMDSADPTWVDSTAPIGGITNLAGEILDGEFTGTFPSGDGLEGGNFYSTFLLDTTGPTVTAANFVDFTHVDVVFSEELEPTTAQTASNYTITGSPAVLAAALDSDGHTVHLATEQQVDSTTHTVTVANVTDLAGNPVVAGVGDTGQWTTPAVPPQVVSATFVDWTHVDVEFSEPVQQTEAEGAANYTITDSPQVLSAVLDPNATTIHLETEMQEEYTTYTVTVRNVRDLAGNAIVPGTGDTAQWYTGRRCKLAWLGVGAFEQDGVDPDRREDLGWFTWKINYFGRAPVYVRLRIYRAGEEIPGSPYGMHPGMGDPATGQTFWFRRQLCKGAYTYRFVAYDGLSSAASEPTQHQPLGVGNLPPRLEWVAAEGYDDNGVEPEGHNPPGTGFTWQVRYVDREGDPPAFVLLHIARLVEAENGDKELVEEPVHGSPFEMTTEDTDYVEGAVFSYTRKLWDEGRYACWFSAREELPPGMTPQDAYGIPTWWHHRGLRVLDAPPQLSWAPGEGFGDQDAPDGLDPDSGPARSFFTLKVAYDDPEGVAASYVRLHLLKGQAGEFSEVAGSPYEMSTDATDFSQPAAYQVQVYIPDLGYYRYYFSASDGEKDAVGEPTWHRMRGPQVGVAAPAVASVTCAAARTGAELVITLSAEASVTAEVLNIAGRPVKLLVSDRLMPAGANVLPWQGRSTSGALVPSGVYLLRVRARDDAGGVSQALASVHITR